MRFLFSLLILMGIASFSLAGFYNGYVEDGFTWNDGYWYQDGQAYTRTRHEKPGYWYCGRYYYGTWYWYYSPVNVNVTVTSKDPNWRSKLLDIAAQRDKYEGEIRKGAFEQAYFLDSVKALGLQGNFTWNGYGTVPPYLLASPHSYTSTVTNFGANATTQYGYSYNNIAQLYGTNDLNSLYQQAAQLTQNAQQLGGQANAGFQTLVSQDGTNRARVAEVLAKGQMASQILQALNTPGGTIQTQGFTFKFDNGKIDRDDTKVPDTTKVAIANQWKALATAKCAECHSGANAKGNFALENYPQMTLEQKQRVWTRLVTPDEKQLMPRTKDGHPGQRLTTEELKLWFLY